MIMKLAKMELRADGLLILIASMVSALMWLSETALRDGDTSATFSTLIYGQIPFPILFAVLGVRKLNQKRGRLLAQLPVSGIAVRISSWLSYLSVIAVACLISAIMLALYPIDVKLAPVTALDRAFPDSGWTLIAAVGALMIAMFTSMVALARISLLASSMRRPTRIVVVSGGCLVLILLFAQWSRFAAGEGPFWVNRVIQWDTLAVATLSAALAFVVADILLDHLVDNRLR